MFDVNFYRANSWIRIIDTIERQSDNVPRDIAYSICEVARLCANSPVEYSLDTLRGGSILAYSKYDKQVSEYLKSYMLLI